MTARAFASDTEVPVDRSRAEINKLLTDWKCASIGWIEHLEEGVVSVEFTWNRDGAIYRVRFTLRIPATITLSKSYWDHATNKFRFDRPLNDDQKKQAWRSAHRLLLLKLKADLNAAQQGLAKAEEIFLPWMVDRDGRTVSDVILPRLRESYAALPPGPKA